MRTSTVALLALAAATLVVACGQPAKSGHFHDEFDGSVFPDRGWIFSGPAPVLDTTAGDPAPSMAWTSCAGTNGAAAQVDKVFDSNYRFTARFRFQVHGSAATPNTGIVFHTVGDRGDDAAMAIEPFPTGQLVFELNGLQAAAPLPADGAFHTLELVIDAQAQAGFLIDGAFAFTNGGFLSTEYITGFECGSGDAGPGPIPIRIDDLDIQSRPSP